LFIKPIVIYATSPKELRCILILVLDSYLEVAAEDLGYKSVAELKKTKYKP